MAKKAYSEADIHSLVDRFEQRTLPKKEWTQEAHLVIAIWYLTNYDKDQALQLVRENIFNYNIAVGTPNSETQGYHESITRFWLWVAKEFLQQNKFTSLSEKCNAFIASPYGKSNYPLLYYSKELLFSIKARKHWVAPDLTKMDKLIIPNDYNTEQLIIRRATVHDIDNISTLIQKNTDNVKENNYSDEQKDIWKKANTREIISEKLNTRTIFCAFSENEIVGTIGLHSNEIVGLYVDHTKQGMGIGRKLLKYLEDHALKMNIHKLTLTATPAAKNFYQNRGYKLVGPESVVIESVIFNETRMEKVITE